MSLSSFGKPVTSDVHAEVAAAIGDIVRTITAGGPPPRGLPYLGLDHASGTRLRLLDELSTRGIFRKYEHVLDLGGGLGASTRYMAARLGCTATATGTPAEVRAGGALTKRAGLDWQVFHVAADATRLPFAEAAFTHVWVVETLPRLGPATPTLFEAARVLRPGGHLGIQDLVLTGVGDDGLPGVLARTTSRHDELTHAGFVEISRRDVTAEAVEHGSRQQIAREQLVRRLGEGHPVARQRQAIAEALATGRLRVVQVTARRP
ncbi:MAG: class I SAM-dependent methyltransferase [Candidatus Binatia bacterium]